MQKYRLWIFTVLLFLGILLNSNVLAEEPTLNQKEIADLVQPSVVKIVQRVTGEAKVPAIDIDFKTMSVITKPQTDPETVPIDEYLTGTGVIVSPDGYIMTNSHVASLETIKNLIVSDYIYQAINEGSAKLNKEETEKLNNSQNSEEITQFGVKITDYILEKSKFDIEKTITVLNPSSNKESLEELVAEGFPASIVSINDNFFKDDRDAALLKINEQNLPAITLGSSEKVSTGKKVYIFGYPSTAEVNEKDLLDPTFTQGTISAIKDSTNKDFKVFQTDAKISKGSSGGPLLDEQGAVIGLVTFITNDFAKQDGDSFAFAIPIDVVKNTVVKNEMADKSLAEFRMGDCNNHFLSGIAFLKNNQCQKALSEFDYSQQANAAFKVSGRLDSYINQCKETINSGNSVDTGWDSFKVKIGNTRYLIFVLFASGIFLVIILAFTWYWLYRKMRRDEKELDNVEKFLHLNLEDGKPIIGNTGIPDLPPEIDRNKKEK